MYSYKIQTSQSKSYHSSCFIHLYCIPTDYKIIPTYTEVYTTQNIFLSTPFFVKVNNFFKF